MKGVKLVIIFGITIGLYCDYSLQSESHSSSTKETSSSSSSSSSSTSTTSYLK
jgi:hypothetical protein